MKPIPLRSEYYLFGAFFPGVQQGRTTTYPTWHKQTSLIGEKISNLRPMAKIPLINITNSDDPKLWATDRNFKLCTLGNGNPDTNGLFEALKPEAPIHMLGSDLPRPADPKYRFRFPPLSLLASLASLEPKELEEQIKTLSQKIGNHESELTLTEISPKQLAPPYEPDPNGSLSTEKQAYNDWYEKVKDKEVLKGFVLPVVASCAVVFSDSGYLNALVSLLKFEVKNENGVEVGEYVRIGERVKASLPEDEQISDDQKQYPCALFHVDPETFEEGLYSIRVEFIRSEMEGEIPDFIKGANIEKRSDGLKTIYIYELREHITFSENMPLGKFAIISGDMISLEESLIRQYPQYFSNLKHYLKGTAQGGAVSTPAARSIALLKGIRDASAELGADIARGNLQNTLASDGRQAVLNNVSKLYWDAINADLPEPMTAAGELYLGIFSVKEAYDSLKSLKDPDLANRNLGWKALIRDKIINRSDFSQSILETYLEHQMGDRRIVASRVSEAWTTNGESIGINAISTIQSGLDLYEAGKAVLEEKEKVKNSMQSMNEVASDYLDRIPVWNTTQHNQGKAVEKALENARNHSDEPITATLVNNERGTGIKIAFAFNSRKTEIEDNAGVLKQLAKTLAEILKNESNLRVEIEGHACQVDTEEVNMKVSEQRAENAKAFLIAASESDIFKDRISVAAFGESKPLYIPKSGEAINRRNPNLKQNRRVEIRIYIQTLDILFHPSRYGAQAMERSRLLLEQSILKKDEAAWKLQVAIFESMVDLGSYIPVIAPFARGVILAKEAYGALIPAVTLLDNVLLDSMIEELHQEYEVVNSLEKLSDIHMTLLEKLRHNKTALNKECHSYKELMDHLSSEEAQKELLKRYQLRALAMNGLILLLAELKYQSDLPLSRMSFEYLIEHYKVKGYIERYILRDDWSVTTISGNTLAASWKNHCESEHSKSEIAKKERALNGFSNYNSAWPVPSSPTGTSSYSSFNRVTSKSTNSKASGAFNRVFPVQTLLFDHPEETMFQNFAHAFNAQEKKVEQEAIGFCRILIKSAQYQAEEKNSWMTYEKWIEQSSSGRIGPYDKVKVQLVLTKSNKYAQEIVIGYDRVDGENLQGPGFRDWMLPMKASDFNDDPGEEIKAFYSQQGVESLIAIEHVPAYRFNSVMIDGLKPLTSESKILLSEAIMAMSKFGGMTPSVLDVFLEQEDAFQRYVANGGFDNMRYCLSVREASGKHCFYLPPQFNRSQYSPSFDIEEVDNEVSVGVLSTESKLVWLDTYIGEQQLLLREKDLLIEDYTKENSETEKPTIPILREIKKQVVALETQSSGLTFFDEKKWYDTDFYSTTHNIARDGFEWGSKGHEDSTSFYILIVGEEHEKALYEKLKMKWKAVNMCIQLEIDGNGDEPAQGPMYYTDMHHVGVLSHQKDNWVLPDCTSKTLSEMASFLKTAMKTVVDEDDLSKDKEYTLYCMKFNCEYVAPTGVRVKGLRPFGEVIGNDFDLTLSISQLQQVGLTVSDNYNENRNAVIALPSLNGDKVTAGYYFNDSMPWVQVKGSLEQGVDKSASETWKKYDQSKREKWVKNWIEKQPTVTQAPKPLEKSLDNPV